MDWLPWAIALIAVVAAVIALSNRETSGGTGSAPSPYRPTSPTSDLIEALDFGTPQEIEAALRKGADANALGSYGKRPLHMAIGSVNAPEKVALLLRYGARVDGRDEEGQTALQWLAFMNGLPESRPADTASVLIARGADIHGRTRDGDTPLHIAALWCKADITEVLLRAGANVRASAVMTGTNLPGGSYTRKTTSRGQRLMQLRGLTPLHYAALSATLTSSVETAATLLRHGAEVNAKSAEGLTPLAIVRAEHDRYRQSSRREGHVEERFERFESLLLRHMRTR